MPFFRSNFNASADDVVSLAGDSVLAGESVLSSDTKKPYKNETLLTIVLTGGTVADLVADGLIAQPDTSVTDIEQYILAVGDIKTDVAVSANAGTLSINASAGTFTYLDTVANPDDIQQTTYTVQSPVTFDLYKQDGLISAGQTLVPVTEYDNNGVVTTITATNDATIHELWANPQVANTFILVMGQTNYGTLNSASDDVAAYTPLLPAAVSGWVRVCRIAARRDTTDLAVSNRAEFHNADKFGQAASVAVVAAMTGATALLDGTQGSAPAPTAGQERRFLRGDATFAEAVEHVFVSDTAMAPATAGTPTLGEVTAAIGTLLKNGCLAYYTGDDIATNTPTYIWHVNEAGDARLISGGGRTIHEQVSTITVRDAIIGVANGDMVTTQYPPVTWLRASGAWEVWDGSHAVVDARVIDATVGIPDNQIDPLVTGVNFRIQNTAGGTPADTIIGFPVANFTQADELYIELSNTGGGTLNAVFNAVYKTSDGTADIGIIAYNTSTDPKSFIFRRKTIAGAGLDEYWLVAGTEYTVSGGLAKLGLITADPAPAAEGIYTLDAAGGAFDFTLPAATGSQSRIMLEALDVETNNVTVKVALAENLNGVLNGTNTLSADQSVYLLIDAAAGRWIIKEVGAVSTSEVVRVSEVVGADTEVSLGLLQVRMVQATGSLSQTEIRVSSGVASLTNYISSFFEESGNTGNSAGPVTKALTNAWVPLWQDTSLNLGLAGSKEFATFTYNGVRHKVSTFLGSGFAQNEIIIEQVEQITVVGVDLVPVTALGSGGNSLGSDYDISGTGGITVFEDTGLDITLAEIGTHEITCQANGTATGDDRRVEVVITNSINELQHLAATLVGVHDAGSVENFEQHGTVFIKVEVVTTAADEVFKLRAAQSSDVGLCQVDAFSYMTYRQLPTHTVVDNTNTPYSSALVTPATLTGATIGGGSGQVTYDTMRKITIGDDVTISGGFSHYQQDNAVSLDFAGLGTVEFIQISRSDSGVTDSIAVSRSGGTATFDRPNAISGNSPFSFIIKGTVA